MGGDAPTQVKEDIGKIKKDLTSPTPENLTRDLGQIMAHGWADPAYRQAFGTTNKNDLPPGFPPPDQIFNAPVGKPTQVGDYTVMHGQDAEQHEVAIIRAGKDNNPGNIVTYVDNLGHTQTFTQTAQGVEVSKDGGEPKKYGAGTTLEVKPDGTPIIHQGDAKTTVDKDGNETTELHGATITRDANGSVTSWHDNKGDNITKDPDGTYYMNRPGAQRTKIDIPEGGQFNVGPDGRPGFTVPGKQNGGITAEIDPATGKVNRYSYPDGSSFYYNSEKQQWFHHDQNDQGSDKDKWVTVPSFNRNSSDGLYTITWKDMNANGGHPKQENERTA